ncbi:energy transducer TonB [Sulfuricurvum sp.]|uniref:energy transducer TonB n=1 Tax=Sulfuricurvum sp. TaxID=2025608 RepID=UPI00261AE121|nr:energy transducer TonB [Sulfuricurvum sp.]MDD4948011.1 TonB family protein [Sulfuricurvum sp.]
MMTTARKSFFLSLMFHSLMGSLAFFVLVKMHTPPPMIKIDTKHIMVLSLADSAPKPKHQEVRDIPAEITPPTPQPIVQQPIIPKPIIPIKAQTPQPTPPIQTPVVTAPPTPIVTTPPVAQRVQNAPAAEVVQAPSKPKIDLASEKRSFYALLRNAIQKNLRYPPAARRRGMEGEVAVRFTLLNDGSIRNISVQHGEDIFHSAAKAAVGSTAGIDIPKNLNDSLPMEMDLTLEFKLTS